VSDASGGRGEQATGGRGDLRQSPHPVPPSPPRPLTVAAVLFDLDGTLVDSGIDFGLMRREMLALAAEVGCDVTELEEADILTIRDLACAHADNPGAVRERAEARLVAIEREALERASPVPGAVALLAALREQGVRVGVVTRNCREIAEESMQRHGLPHDVMVAREDTPRVKPHPLHLWRAVAALDVSPAAAVMVGDGRMDVQAGKAAGLRTVGFLADGRPADYFVDLSPDRVINSLPDLLPWISPSSS
jgi:phosphoglycolate phosphatase